MARICSIPARAYAGRTWRVAETADELIDAGRIPPLLIVGVDHAGPDRVREYTPTPGRDCLGGSADRHARFLVHMLPPFLRKTHGVTREAAGVGLGGLSLGGLATLFVASAEPGQFGRLLAMSPSIWWDRRAILRQLRQYPLADDTRVWLDAGAREGAKTMRNVRDVRHLLQRQDPRVQVRYMMDPDGEHDEDSWARRFGDALRYLFDDWR